MIVCSSVLRPATVGVGPSPLNPPSATTVRRVRELARRPSRFGRPKSLSRKAIAAVVERRVGGACVGRRHRSPLIARGRRAEGEATVIPALPRRVHRRRRLRHGRIRELGGRAAADRIRRRLIGAERNVPLDSRLRRRRTGNRSAAADHRDRALVDQLVGQRCGRRRGGRVVALLDDELRAGRLSSASTSRSAGRNCC